MKKKFVLFLFFSCLFTGCSYNEKTELKTENFQETTKIKKEKIKKVSETRFKLPNELSPSSGTWYIKQDSILYKDKELQVETNIFLSIGEKIEIIGINDSIICVKYKDNPYYLSRKNVSQSLKDFISDFQFEGEISNESIEIAQKYYFKIPENFRNRFKENGWRIIISDEDLNEKYYESISSIPIAGLTVYNDKTIYLGNYGINLSEAVIHEFGHYFDFINGRISNTEEFLKLFHKEKNNLYFLSNTLKNNAKEQSSEFFAECFQQYFNRPELFKDTCPETYQFFLNLLEVN